MQGAEIDTYVSNSTDCITNAEEFVNLFISSLTNFFKSGVNVDSYLNFAKSMQPGSPALKVCYNASTDGIHELFSYLRQFPSTKVYVNKMIWNSLYNFVHWYSLVGDLKASIKAKNSTTIAFHAGEATHLLLAVSPDLSKVNSEEDKAILDSLTTFVVSFLKGSTFITNDAVEDCVTKYSGFKTLVKDFENALHESGSEAEARAVYDLADLMDTYYPLNT